MEVVRGSEVSGGGEYVKLADLVGKMVAFVPSKYREKDVVTKYGEKDAIVSDVLMIAEQKDGKWGWCPEGNDAVIHRGQMFLQGRIIGKLKHNIGKAVIGVIVKRPSDKGNDAYDVDDTSFPTALWPKVVEFTERNYKRSDAVSVAPTSQADVSATFEELLNGKLDLDDMKQLANEN